MSFLSDVLQGIMGNEQADKAADAQVKATQAASQTTMDMFRLGNQITAPNQQAGWNALAMQGSLLGNPNLVPQSAIQTALDASGDPNAKWQAYTQQYKPEIDAFYRQNAKTFDRLGRDPIRAAQHYYNTVGSIKGHAMPTGQPMGTGTPGTPGSTGIGVGTSTDQAYNTFLDSGFGRANLTTTNADFENMVGAFGAGGTSLSGSAIGALNDRNRRNTAGAFNNYYNALAGISGTGAQLGGQQSAAANQAGQTVANNQMQAGNARASSYANRYNWGNALGDLEKNAAQVAGWFSSPSQSPAAHGGNSRPR